MIGVRKSGIVSAAAWVLAIGATAPTVADAQVIASEGLVTVGRGTSALLPQATTVRRVSIGDPAIADAVVVSPREVLVNAKALGTTTLFVWDVNENRRIYNIEVTVDAAALQRQFRALFPTEQIAVTASGNTVILSGRASASIVAARALEIARATGATVVDNLTVPPAQQVLLQVRFAEVSRTAASQLGVDYRAGETSTILSPLTPRAGDRVIGLSSSDGLLNISIFEDNIQFEAAIQALKSRGLFRSLAEPNLLALDGTEASFLAGGEFPYPVPQAGGSGGGAQTITVVFREFGVRLRFLPRVTSAGNVRLDVEPEVSSLDFSNGLQISGFAIPSILSRKAKTQVELRPGQTFAIAGLLDNSILDNVDRIPFLGDIPILGSLFRSRDTRQQRNELLVLVTPRLVEPLNEAPPVPTGEADTWPWDPALRGKSPQAIPSRRSSAPAPATSLAGVASPAGTGAPDSAPTDVHVVAAGDTLARIAGRYGVTAQALMSANGLSDTTIRPGQRLVVPSR